MTTTPAARISTRHESSLHVSLKRHYAREGDEIEAPVDGFRIDVVRHSVREGQAGYDVPLLLEIQTRSFSAIRPKLYALLATHRVRLVYPVACEKWIVKIKPTGAIISRRRSPKRGCVEHVFDELVSFPDLMSHPNLTLDVVLTREEEIRCNDGKGSWRRGGWSVRDRRLIEVADVITFSESRDFLRFLPLELADPFTSRDLAKSLGRSISFARRVTYCLRKMGAIRVVGKRHWAWLYACPRVGG
jgi:hypothetical protein